MRNTIGVVKNRLVGMALNGSDLKPICNVINVTVIFVMFLVNQHFKERLGPLLLST